jgi:hypothetical protein
MSRVSRSITFPKQDDPEIQTRRAIVDILTKTPRPLYLKCEVTRVHVRAPRLGPYPILQLDLLVSPPDEMPKLVLFRVYISRHIRPLKIPDEPFWFEEVLGKVSIPWGSTLSEDASNAVFKDWIGKTALVKLDITSFDGTVYIHAITLQSIPNT